MLADNTSNMLKDLHVQRHPQTLSIYLKEAARWLVDSDRASSHKGRVAAAVGAEVEAIDEVIYSILSVQVDSSETATGF